MSAYEIDANLYRFLVTKKSRNAKTGPIMVTTSQSSTCPDACPFKKGACYAKAGPLAKHWRDLDNESHVATKTFDALLAAIESQSTGSLWRMNQAGDLPGQGDTIDVVALAKITDANHGRKGFTYTHKPMTAENAAAVADANANGFTVNLSANNLHHADQLADLGIAPVVTVLPVEQTANCKTPAGRTVVVCPATKRDDVSCATCGLCQRQRSTIVGFPAHGASARKASAIAQA